MDAFLLAFPARRTTSHPALPHQDSLCLSVLCPFAHGELGAVGDKFRGVADDAGRFGEEDVLGVLAGLFGGEVGCQAAFAGLQAVVLQRSELVLAVAFFAGLEAGFLLVLFLAALGFVEGQELGFAQALEFGDVFEQLLEILVSGDAGLVAALQVGQADAEVAGRAEIGGLDLDPGQGVVVAGFAVAFVVGKRREADVGGIKTGCQAVIDDTLAKMAAFPDLTILAEDVIWSGSDTQHYLSSHRTLISGTQTGEATYGPASGRRYTARCIADCAVTDGVFDDEWLVFDSSSIVRQLGHDPRDFVRRQIASERGSKRPFTPDQDLPGAYTLRGNDNAWGGKLVDILTRIMRKDIAVIGQTYDRAVRTEHPGGQGGWSVPFAESAWMGLR